MAVAPKIVAVIRNTSATLAAILDTAITDTIKITIIIQYM